MNTACAFGVPPCKEKILMHCGVPRRGSMPTPSFGWFARRIPPGIIRRALLSVFSLLLPCGLRAFGGLLGEGNA